MKNKYLAQSNQFTESFFPYKKEIHKDCIYLIQNNIDFYGEVKEDVIVSIDDYCNFKGIKKKDTYTNDEFFKFFEELTEVSGGFINRLDNTIVKFNLIQDAKIDSENSSLIKIKLTEWSKRFFFQKEMKNYIASLVKDKKIKYTGHTLIDNNIGSDLKGLKRKIFYEILSQFKHTGYCRISVFNLKQRLGYIKLVEKDTRKEVSKEKQLKMYFVPEDKYEYVDEKPRFNDLEKDFLKPAIKAINNSLQVDINNLMIKNKVKDGRKIVSLEFTFNALGHELTQEEIETKKMFMDLGLDEGQVHDMLKRIGYQEMYGRYMKNIRRRVDHNISDKALFFDVETGQQIKNMGGYCYSKLFPELSRVNT